MEYIKKLYDKEQVSVQIGMFRKAGKCSECHLILIPFDNLQTFEKQYGQLTETLAHIRKELGKRYKALFGRWFVSDAANQAETIHREASDFPYAVVQQPPLNGSKAALWVYFAEVEGEKGIYTHNGYTHLWNAALHHRNGSTGDQTQELFDKYDSLLAARNGTLENDCVRTWLFVQNVDVNYAAVVKARREHFERHGLTPATHYIASTGIEGRDADPAVTVQMDAYAVKGLEAGQQRYLYARDYLNPTYEYGVTFERGVAVEYGDRKQIFISGTASIDNKGEVVHRGNILLQTRRMLENVEALLNEAGATMDDIIQAIVYLRDPADYPAVKSYLGERIARTPRLILLAPVCRPGWLIEMECIAVKDNENNRFRDF